MQTMKTRSIILAIAAAFTLAACAEKTAAPEQPANRLPLKISASMEQLKAAGATKVGFKDPANKDYAVNWQIGDRIKVFNQPGATNYVMFKVSSIDAAGKAFFEVDNDYVTATGDARNDMSVLDPSKDVYYAHFGALDEQLGYMEDDGSIHTGRLTMVYLKPDIINSEYHNCIAKATIGADGSLDFNFLPTICYIKVTLPETVPEGCYLPDQLIVAGQANTVNLVTGRASGHLSFTIEDSGLNCLRKTLGGQPAQSYADTDGDFTNIEYFQAGKTYYLPVFGNFEMRGFKICREGVNNDYLGNSYKRNTGNYGTVNDLGIIPLFQYP